MPGNIQDSVSTLLGKAVVLDTRTPFIYIGVLQGVDEFLFILEGADVHDMTASTTPKELYILEARRFGIQRSRHRVFVRADQVVSFSLLEEVILY
ncbi:MAG: hypothetical protein HYU36_14600 [Planctomycetes bacterium]|nr:hypothetical protein [Planctomycetota bacterium]